MGVPRTSIADPPGVRATGGRGRNDLLVAKHRNGVRPFDTDVALLRADLCGDAATQDFMQELADILEEVKQGTLPAGLVKVMVIVGDVSAHLPKGPDR